MALGMMGDFISLCQILDAASEFRLVGQRLEMRAGRDNMKGKLAVGRLV